MKKSSFFSLLLCLPLVFQAQRSLSGVWSGSLSNDSSTVRQEQSFEMALTQYREKVYGYSRTSFLVNDTLYYILKRVKGDVSEGVCEIRDDEIISYNFPGKIDKGIKVTTIFRMNKQDTTWHLDGKWSTNKTKRYYAITGTSTLRAESDPSESKIFAHLQELRLENEIVQTPAANEPSVAANKNPASRKTEPPVPARSFNASPAAELHSRQNVIIQEIEFRGDSLQLALYDNGEVDGDTVTVLVHNEIILSKEMLKATALKTIVIPPSGVSEFLLILYAENLGKYPPNTGLLLLKDGTETHQIRFSADLQRNAAILLRRKN